MSVTVDKYWTTDRKRNLQRLINQYGFTDDMGNKLAEDGIIGPKSTQALKKMNDYQQDLIKPDRGTGEWQAQLRRMNYKKPDGSLLDITGVRDPYTDAAINDFENGFLDGFTGGTNKKKSIPKQTFPTMPKMSDAEIMDRVDPYAGQKNPDGTWKQIAKPGTWGGSTITHPEDGQLNPDGTWKQIARPGTWGGSTITHPEDGQLNPDGTWKQIAKPGAWSGSDGSRAAASTTVSGLTQEQQAKLNTKQKIIDMGTYDYTANQDTRKAVANALNLNPNIGLPELTNYLQTYLVQRGDQFAQNGYALTPKNLDTIFGAGKGDAAKAEQTTNYVPIVTEYQDEAKKAGVTSGFNGSGLTSLEMPNELETIGVGAYDLYDHTTLDRNATQDAQNTYRKALEYLKQKQATDTLNLNEAQPKYEQAKTAGAPDVRDWQNRYMDAHDAVDSNKGMAYQLQGLLNLAQKNQQLAQQANLKNNPDFEAVAQEGANKATGGKDAYIAQKAVPFDPDNMKYFFMTPDERKTYFYIKQTQGDTIANQYMDNLNSSLVKRVAEEFSDAEAKNPFMAGVEQIRGGLSNWGTGMLQSGVNLFGSQNQLDPSLYQMAAELTQQKVTDPNEKSVLKAMYDWTSIAPDLAMLAATLFGVGKGIVGRVSSATRVEGSSALENVGNRSIIKTTDGATRATQFANNWPEASLNDAINKFAPNAKPYYTDSYKLVYLNDDTGIAVVYDTKGDYFRVEDTSRPRGRNYLDMDGNDMNNQSIAGKQSGRSKSDYQSVTHYKNTDRR